MITIEIHYNQTTMTTNKSGTYVDNSIAFTIEGNPKALSRPIISRASKSSKKVWLRDPCKEAKERFRESVRKVVFKCSESTANVVFNIDIPLTVDISFFLQVPQCLFTNHQQRPTPGSNQTSMHVVKLANKTRSGQSGQVRSRRFTRIDL
jgi:hypothetical protein